jgi:glycosyltransferase involved in cell wall biosynthesis
MELLFVAPRVPWPLDTGAKIRTFHMLRGLAQDHQTRALVFADSPEEEQAAEGLGQALTGHVTELEIVARATPLRQRARDAVRGFLGPAPYNIRKYERDAMAAAVLRACERKRPDMVHCDHLHMARYGELASRRFGVRHCMDEHNVESLIFERFVENKRGLVKLAFYEQSVLLRRYEAQAARAAWGCLVCSAEDGQKLTALSGQRNVHVTPNGVDLDKFGETVTPLVTDHLVLTGSMDWAPNEDAGLWFHAECLAEVRRSSPGIPFYLVGRNPSEKLRALAAKDPLTIVSGTVPDVRPYLSGARCLVVPMRVGGGTRLKILEAFAARVPVVSTRVGAEGIAAKDGDEVLFAETPTEFATAIARLATDPTLATRLRTRARTLAESTYGWKAIAASAARFYQGSLS